MKKLALAVAAVVAVLSIAGCGTGVIEALNIATCNYVLYMFSA
jgi:hypothetical protein